MEKYKFALETITQTRLNMIKIVQACSIEEINKTPANFNNNLIWNFVHVIVTQQLLCYALAGEKPVIGSAIIDAYRKGSTPGEAVTKADLDTYIKMATDTLEQFEKDINKGLFQNYKPYETSFGLTLRSFDDALQFNLAHETLHLGAMIVMRKFL